MISFQLYRILIYLLPLLTLLTGCGGGGGSSTSSSPPAVTASAPASGSAPGAPVSSPPPAVPAAYQPLFDAVSNDLNLFSAAVNAQYPSRPTATKLYSVLVNADSNAIYFKLQGASAQTVAAYAQIAIGAAASLQSQMGIQGVQIPICYPALVDNPANLPSSYFTTANYANYLSYYQQVFQGVRALGLDIVVETNLVLPGSGASNVDFSYQGITVPMLEAGEAEVAQHVLDDLHPDCINLATEPLTISYNTGLSQINTPSGYAGYVQAIRSSLNTASSPSTKIGAGSDDWQSVNFITQLLSSTHLDYYDMHLYNPDDLLTGISMLQQLTASGKPVSITENFLNKQAIAVDGSDAPLSPDVIFVRNAYSFWAPVDAQYTASMLQLANGLGLQFVSFNDTDFLYTYVDYDDTTAGYSFSQMQSAVFSGVDAAKTASTESSYGDALRAYVGR